MTFRFFRADRHSMCFARNDRILEIEPDTLSDNTWESCSLEDQYNHSHPEPLLESVTWLDGTSPWMYHQDPDSQLGEFSLDEYGKLHGETAQLDRCSRDTGGGYVLLD